MKIELLTSNNRIPEIKKFYESCGYFGPVTEADQIILATANEAIIGVVRLVNENTYFLLRGMYLRDDWHRKGIGSQMLKSFLELVKRNQIEEVTLICGPHLNNFYGQIGFRKIEKEEAPTFIVERSIGYAKHYGEQIVMRLQPALNK